MKVKFKMYSPDGLRMLGHTDEEIRKIPFCLYLDKEFVGELVDNTIVYNNGRSFNANLVQYIKPETE